MDNTSLDTTSSNSTTTLDGEDVLNRHQEWLVEIVLWNVEVFVHSMNEFHNSVFAGWIAFESLECRTLDDWSVVAIVAILVEKFANVHLDELD